MYGNINGQLSVFFLSCGNEKSYLVVMSTSEISRSDSSRAEKFPSRVKPSWDFHFRAEIELDFFCHIGFLVPIFFSWCSQPKNQYFSLQRKPKIE